VVIGSGNARNVGPDGQGDADKRSGNERVKGAKQGVARKKSTGSVVDKSGAKVGEQEIKSEGVAASVLKTNAAENDIKTRPGKEGDGGVCGGATRSSSRAAGDGRPARGRKSRANERKAGANGNLLRAVARGGS
jgi:hypothetical protein